MKATELIGELWAAYRYERTYDQRRRAGQAAELLAQFIALADELEQWAKEEDGRAGIRTSYGNGVRFAAKRLREIAEGRE